MTNIFKKALFFRIDNLRDKCAFCGGQGPMVMGLSCGLCICPKCVGLASDMVKLESSIDEFQRISESPQFRLENKTIEVPID